MTKSALARQLERLARRQRNRIWLQRTGRRFGPAAGYCATVLVLAGAVHQLLLPLDASLIIGAATLPPLLYLGWFALAQKPTAQQGAAGADRRFGADSLLVTAWEISRSKADLQRVEKLLLERCASRLPAWLDSSAPVQRVNLKPSNLFTLTLALAGLFFLVQASHVQPPADSQVIAGSPAGQATGDSARALRELLDSNMDWPPQSSAPRADAHGNARAIAAADAHATAPTALVAEATEGSPGDAARQPPPGNPPSGMTDGAASSGAQDDATTVAAGVGVDAAPTPGTDTIAALTLNQADFIDIETGSAHNSKASDDTGEGSALLASPAQQVISLQPAGEPSRQMPVAGPGYQLSPLQRSLVWRYLARLEENNDAKE